MRDRRMRTSVLLVRVISRVMANPSTSALNRRRLSKVGYVDRVSKLRQNRLRQDHDVLIGVDGAVGTEQSPLASYRLAWIAGYDSPVRL